MTWTRAPAATSSPIETLHGLNLHPIRVDPRSVKRMVSIPAGNPTQALARLLGDITRFYGRPTAARVALHFEDTDSND